MTAFQLGEEGSLSGSLALALEVEQYFFRITLAHGASLSWYNLQFSLARRAIFLALVACIPSPPSSLGLTILFQPTRCIFLLSFVEPPQKVSIYLIQLIIYVHRESHHLHHMVGDERHTNLIRTACPAKERNLAFQPASLFMTFLAIKLYCRVLAPLCIIGKLRYFPMFWVAWMPNISQIFSYALSLTLAEK